MNNIDKIKDLLRRKRDLDAESRVLHSQLMDARFSKSKLSDAIQQVDDQLFRIETWLMLLNEDEAYVIKRHLIDGVDLSRVTQEYKERWGEDYSKTDRTIKTYQRKGLQKIAQFEAKKHPHPDDEDS